LSPGYIADSNPEEDEEDPEEDPTDYPVDGGDNDDNESSDDDEDDDDVEKDCNTPKIWYAAEWKQWDVKYNNQYIGNDLKWTF
ncbi:hypothetical protein Tco_0457229, partial [Tanacetum coccineum]